MMASVRISATSSGVISGSGLAMAKMIGFFAIDWTMAGVSAPLADRPKKTSAPSSASASVRASVWHGMRRLPLVHAFFAALVDDALGVAQDDVLRCEAHRLDEFDAGDARRARAVAHELGVGHVAPGQVQRVDEAGDRDDGGAVLVVVEDGDVHQFAQALLDDEAFRRLDVFEIDAAEGRAEELARS